MDKDGDCKQKYLHSKIRPARENESRLYLDPKLLFQYVDERQGLSNDGPSAILRDIFSSEILQKKDVCLKTIDAQRPTRKRILDIDEIIKFNFETAILALDELNQREYEEYPSVSEVHSKETHDVPEKASFLDIPSEKKEYRQYYPQEYPPDSRRESIQQEKTLPKQDHPEECTEGSHFHIDIQSGRDDLGQDGKPKHKHILINKSSKSKMQFKIIMNHPDDEQKKGPCACETMDQKSGKSKRILRKECECPGSDDEAPLRNEEKRSSLDLDNILDEHQQRRKKRRKKKYYCNEGLCEGKPGGEKEMARKRDFYSNNNNNNNKFDERKRDSYNNNTNNNIKFEDRKRGREAYSGAKTSEQRLFKFMDKNFITTYMRTIDGNILCLHCDLVTEDSTQCTCSSDVNTCDEVESEFISETDAESDCSCRPDSKPPKKDFENKNINNEENSNDFDDDMTTQIDFSEAENIPNSLNEMEIPKKTSGNMKKLSSNIYDFDNDSCPYPNPKMKELKRDSKNIKCNDEKICCSKLSRKTMELCKLLNKQQTKLQRKACFFEEDHSENSKNVEENTQENFEEPLENSVANERKTSVHDDIMNRLEQLANKLGDVLNSKCSDNNLPKQKTKQTNRHSQKPSENSVGSNFPKQNSNGTQKNTSMSPDGSVDEHVPKKTSKGSKKSSKKSKGDVLESKSSESSNPKQKSKRKKKKKSTESSSSSSTKKKAKHKHKKHKKSSTEDSTSQEEVRKSSKTKKKNSKDERKSITKSYKNEYQYAKDLEVYMKKLASARQSKNSGDKKQNLDVLSSVSDEVEVHIRNLASGSERYIRNSKNGFANRKSRNSNEKKDFLENLSDEVEVHVKNLTTGSEKYISHSKNGSAKSRNSRQSRNSGLSTINNKKQNLDVLANLSDEVEVHVKNLATGSEKYISESKNGSAKPKRTSKEDKSSIDVLKRISNEKEIAQKDLTRISSEKNFAKTKPKSDFEVLQNLSDHSVEVRIKNLASGSEKYLTRTSKGSNIYKKKSNKSTSSSAVYKYPTYNLKDTDIQTVEKEVDRKNIQTESERKMLPTIKELSFISSESSSEFSEIYEKPKKRKAIKKVESYHSCTCVSEQESCPYDKPCKKKKKKTSFFQKFKKCRQKQICKCDATTQEKSFDKISLKTYSKSSMSTIKSDSISSIKPEVKHRKIQCNKNNCPKKNVIKDLKEVEGTIILNDGSEMSVIVKISQTDLKEASKKTDKKKFDVRDEKKLDELFEKWYKKFQEETKVSSTCFCESSESIVNIYDDSSEILKPRNKKVPPIINPKRFRQISYIKKNADASVRAELCNPCNCPETSKKNPENYAENSIFNGPVHRTIKKILNRGANVFRTAMGIVRA